MIVATDGFQKFLNFFGKFLKCDRHPFTEDRGIFIPPPWHPYSADTLRTPKTIQNSQEKLQWLT